MGAAILNPLNGRKLSQVVGWLGFAWNFPRNRDVGLAGVPHAGKGKTKAGGEPRERRGKKLELSLCAAWRVSKVIKQSHPSPEPAGSLLQRISLAVDVPQLVSLISITR